MPTGDLSSFHFMLSRVQPFLLCIWQALECPKPGLEFWLSCDDFGKSTNLSEPQFPNHLNGNDSTDLTEL